ncbi:MAG: N-acetylmuramoyl-L-alanine amidase [Alistipes sp.]|nr:N-acetylmuramoyl-L-alanine amidase [Alistipes sp.]
MNRVVKIIFSLLVLSLCVAMSSSAFAQNNGVGVRVIVIDAGHGGRAFPGAVYGGVKEKDINLKVALKLGELIERELPSVKVVYTRKTDTALGKTLNEDLTARANIANKAEGDFFISIHANAAPSSRSVYGAETIIMGESEKETRYNETALYNNNKDELIDMSDENTAAMVRAYIQNLQFTYGEYSEMMARIMQSHYAKGGRKDRRVNRQLLKVLYATDMPSVLTELGFMTNAKELAYMNSEKGQNELARMLCNAVKEYVGHVNKMSGVTTEILPAEQSAEKEEPTQVESATTETVAADVAKETSSANGQRVGNARALYPSGQKSSASRSEQGDSSDKKSDVTSEGYAIQLLASDKKISTSDSQFKSYRGKVKCYVGSGVLKYKYCYGNYATQGEAQRNLSGIRKIFKGAFVVHYNDGRIVK